MGATLPAIARWVETTPDGVSWLGFFYGGNIAGACFGCLLAGFYLLRVYDMATTTVVAVINAASGGRGAACWPRNSPSAGRAPLRQTRRGAAARRLGRSTSPSGSPG